MEAEDGHAMQIDGVEDRVQVDIELSRGEETDPGQRKWYRAGSTVNIKESDKLAVLTDCGAQDMTISGGRVVQDQEGLEEPSVNVQQEDCPITSDIGKVPRGKDNKFQFIRAFWKERSGEIDQGQAGGQVEAMDIAGGQVQGKVGQTGGGQDEAEEQDHPGVQGGRVQEHTDQLHKQTGEQQQAADRGQGDGDRQAQ